MAVSVASEERLKWECDRCHKSWLVTVSHYDRFRCPCGAAYWALRPDRGGKLVAFPWPGTPEMARFKRESGDSK